MSRFASTSLPVLLVLPVLLALLVLLGPKVARAHLDLIDPPSRYARADLKDGPCGITGGRQGEPVAVYEPGQTLAITIDEYIDHPSHYRVAFDSEGDDDFQDPVCLESCDTAGPDPVFAPSVGGIILADHVEDAPEARQVIEVTLPDIECDRCVIQVIQVMYDKRPYTSPGNDNYYRCADVILRRDAAAVDLGVAPDPDLGPPAADGGRVDAGAPELDSDGGCATGGAGATGALLGLLSLAALRRRGGSSRRGSSGCARASSRGRA